MEIKGYIFDIDNTLMSSTDAHYQSWQYALNNHEIVLSEEFVKKEFGNPTNQIGITFANGNVELGKKLAQEKTDYLLETIPKVPPYKGIPELLKFLHEQGHPICFASSNFESVIDEFVKVNKWDEISVGYVGIDNLRKSKPHPEMIYRCLGKLNLPARECVMVGDSICDIEAGQGADTKTIGVCTGINNRETFKPYNPDLVLDKLSDINKLLPLDL